ncbi:MAG: PEP/pyruvate-binding domain-containing protein [Pseudobdellovibrionaceae bacterium]
MKKAIRLLFCTFLLPTVFSACVDFRKNQTREVSSFDQDSNNYDLIGFKSPRFPHDLSSDEKDRRGAFAPPAPSPISKLPFLKKIESLEQIQELGQPSTGLVPGGLSVKLIVDLRQGTPQAYFMNHNFRVGNKIPDSAKYHYNFAVDHLNATESPEEFNSKNYFNPDVRKHTFIQGTLQTYEYEGAALYGIHLYPQDVLREEGILVLMQAVAAALGEELRPLAFVQQNTAQTINSVGSKLDEIGVKKFTIDQLIKNLSYIPMNEGTTYGYLRMFPEDVNTLSPKDIPFFDKIPLDLSVVAGVITKDVQDPGSHINLKSKERKTPNMVLRKDDLIENMKKQNGKPIKLEVKRDGFHVSKSSKEEIDNFYNEKLKSVKPLKLKVDPKAKLTDYETMCPSSPALCVNSLEKFGGKAAKLGFLAHKKVLGIGSTEQKRLGYRLTPTGFAVPLQNYVDFVNDPKNADLKKDLTQFITQEQSGNAPSGAARAKAIKNLQEKFYKAHLPEKQLNEINAAIVNLKKHLAIEFPGVTLKKLKIRSSANAEDIPEFDGAGLHSSFGAKLKLPATSTDLCTTEVDSDGEGDVETKMKMEPENLTCAIKGVYASLWNQRAVEERSNRKIDHWTVAMGLAVVPSYSFLKDQNLDDCANSVVITRVINTSGTYGYTLSTQVGENLATNPIPGTQAELCIATFLTPQ